MPPSAKDAFVILFDVNTKCKSEALSVLSHILFLKELSASKDLPKVFLLNTSTTENKQGFEGIAYLDLQELKTTIVLQEISSYGIGKSNWLEAFELGIGVLKECYLTNQFVTLQLLLITDFSSATDQLLNVSKNVIEDINYYDIFLYIVGPDVGPLSTIISQKDIINWKNTMVGHSSDSKFAAVANLIKRTHHSLMCDYKCGVHLFNSFKYQMGMQPWTIPLSMGSCLELPVHTLRIIKEEPPFKLLSEAKKVSGIVKWVYADDEETQVNYEDTVGGLIRHGKFVQIETDDMFKVHEPRSFSIVGFTSKKNIPECLFQTDSSYLVLPNMRDPDGFSEIFFCLVDVLSSANKYAIARRVYNANNNPKFVALIPETFENVKGFIMFELPYAEDVAYNYYEKDEATAKLIKQDKEICEFLEGMDITKQHCKMVIPLGPSMMVDPSCIDILRKVESKLLERPSQFLKIEPTSLDTQMSEALLSCWPQREKVELKKEEIDMGDDFDEIGDFSFE
ncbi:uncharacterized protein LOC132700657 [Cylas formicarius]|uniref:uncharacterized protein LOC132700657 n=1 Tax=Cylas formicarius TaxID=197179 RepID=UPI0029587CCB|nr:uncharacterized protein LOC132700657 [Cylas formicarius]